MENSKRNILRTTLIGALGTVSLGATVKAVAQASGGIPNIGKNKVPLLVVQPDKSLIAIEESGKNFKAFSVPANPESGTAKFFDSTKPMKDQLAEYNKTKTAVTTKELEMPDGKKIPINKGMIVKKDFDPAAFGVTFKDTVFLEAK